MEEIVNMNNEVINEVLAMDNPVLDISTDAGTTSIPINATVGLTPAQAAAIGFGGVAVGVFGTLAVIQIVKLIKSKK